MYGVWRGSRTGILVKFKIRTWCLYYYTDTAVTSETPTFDIQSLRVNGTTCQSTAVPMILSASAWCAGRGMHIDYLVGFYPRTCAADQRSPEQKSPEVCRVFPEKKIVKCDGDHGSVVRFWRLICSTCRAPHIRSSVRGKRLGKCGQHFGTRTLRRFRWSFKFCFQRNSFLIQILFSSWSPFFILRRNYLLTSMTEYMRTVR